jgi:hypothetical protein
MGCSGSNENTKKPNLNMLGPPKPSYIAPPAAKPIVSTNNNTSVTWLILGEKLNSNHGGIKCGKGHHICPGWCKGFAQSVISDPEANIPIKCPVPNCNVGLNSADLEKHMTKSQLKTYQMYKKCVEINSSGKNVDSCPYCKYCEVSNNKTIFYCKNPDCEEVSWLVCLESVKVSTWISNKQSREVNLNSDVLICL